MDQAIAIDCRIGQRLRKRRVELNLTQTDLSAAVGVSFQQLQKYERGTNRISASRLHALCRVLNVPPGYFFDAPTRDQGSEQIDDDLYKQLQNHDCRKLNEAFRRIEVIEVRRAIVTLVEAIAVEETISRVLTHQR